MTLKSSQLTNDTIQLHSRVLLGFNLPRIGHWEKATTLELPEFGRFT